MEVHGGPLRDSFKHDVTVPDFTAPVSERERMDAAHAAAFAQDISVLRDLKKKCPSRFALAVFAGDVLDEKHTAFLVELDFAIEKIRRCDLNRTAPGLFRNHVDGFLRERVPEQRSLAFAVAHDCVHGLTPASPVFLLFVGPFANQHHERFQLFVRPVFLGL